MPIRSVFPIPIYVENDKNILIKEDNKLLQKIFYKEGTVLRGGGATGAPEKEFHKISKNNYILDVDGLDQVKQKILNHIKKYIKETLSPILSESEDGLEIYERDLEFYITQSWLNVHVAGSRHPKHQHPNSIVSGIFYIKVLEQDKISFEHHNNQLSPTSSPSFEFDPCNKTRWNSRNIEFALQPNDIYIFPSWLTHYVEKVERTTKQPEERISLSFNTFVRGTLGEARGLLELKLN